MWPVTSNGAARLEDLKPAMMSFIRLSNRPQRGHSRSQSHPAQQRTHLAYTQRAIDAEARVQYAPRSEHNTTPVFRNF